MKEKIDFVVTWVDGNDPKWQSEKAKYESQYKRNDDKFDNWNNNKIRYRDWNLLKYWFRAVEKNAPWVNKIYFVTYGHKPEWLNEQNKKLVVVNHKDFIPEKYLPTFNSNCIELNMHRIKGLSEKFVYFNDDVFLLRKTTERDFFKNKLPKETAGVDCVALDWNVGHAEIKNLQIVNKYFNKREVLKKTWKKWFNLKNGKEFIKTCFLLPWDQFTGLYESHITYAYLKDTFDKVWNKEPDVLNETCMSKFRNDSNVNHWIFKDWQLATGLFYPRSPKFGKMFLKKIDKEILNSVKRKKYKVVSINDVDYTEEEFVIAKKQISEAFDSIYPEKSSFEK